MATVRIVLRKKKRKDGAYPKEFPLAICITKNRVPAFIYVGQEIEEKYWDKKGQEVKKGHPNAARLNNFLLKKKAEANTTLLDMETHERAVSARVVKSQIKPRGGTSFFSQADAFVENLRLAGNYGRYKTEEGRIKEFRKFTKRDITFPEITDALLKQFKVHLKTNRKVKEKPISDRTVTNYLMLIRTIYNEAKKNHIVDEKNYPFGKGKIVIKFNDSIKIGLNSKEVKALEDAQLSGYQNHARNVWLVAFYFAGMRLADVLKLKWSDLKDNRLHYAMSKNQKPGSLKVPEKALTILQQYRLSPKKHDFVFPELQVLDTLEPYEVKRKISFAGKRLNDALKEIIKDLKIKKNISMHIARHTFAQIAGDKIPVQLLQKLYRHSNITTTIGYQSHFSNKETDNALGSVLDF